MSREADAALQAKILQIGFVVFFVAVVLYAVRGMMYGSTMVSKLFAVGLLGTALVFVLDERYWLLPVFLFGFSKTIPQLRFTGAELGSLVLLAMFFVRMALRRDLRVKGCWWFVLAAVPFLTWMCLIWSMNPVGMNIFGSSRIGGRFYFKVILAFLSMFCLSFKKFDETDCKLALWSMSLGYVAFVLMSFLWVENEELELVNTVHYEFLRLSFVAPAFLCRFTVPELMLRFWPFMGVLFCFVLSVYSGNRTAAARPVLVGLMAPFFLRRDRVKTIALCIVGALALTVLVYGQGRTWDLPYSVQRSLSFLPGNWDWRLRSYGFQDNFRKKLRMYAREHIAERPWFGDGGFSIDFEEMAWTASNLDQEGINLHVLSRNWHNVWLGMAADFGIPLSVAWALFMAVLLLLGFKGSRHLPGRTWQETAYLYFYLLIVTEFVNFFFNGGHTANTAEQVFIWTGLLAAIRNGVQSRMGFPGAESR